MNPGPYDPCTCGSGKKYKFCHGSKGRNLPLAEKPAAIDGSPVVSLLAQTLRRGLADQNAGRLAEAEAAYRKVLEAEPDNADALHLFGTIAYLKGDFAVAIDLINRAIGKNPTVPEFYADVGHALKQAGRPDEASESYRRALQLRPAFADVQNNLGLLLQAQGNIEAARSLFEQAISANPTYVNAIMNLGVLFIGQGDLVHAEQNFRLLLNIEPSLAEAHNNLGTVLHARGLFADAIACFRTAIGLKPTYADARSNLGGSLEALGDFAGAENTYREAIALGGRHSEIRINLGRMHHRLGNHARAIAEYRELLASHPLLPKAHVNLGVVFQSQDRLHEALAHYVVALAMQPNQAELLNNVGSILQHLGRIGLAVSFFDRASTLAPDSADAWTNLGSAIYTQGRIQEAVENYRRALAIDSAHVEANANVSMAQLALGQFPDTWRQYDWRFTGMQKQGLEQSPILDIPEWSGNPLNGETLLVRAEQGIGDEIWFGGMFDDLTRGPAARGRVILECSEKLLPLFRRSFGKMDVVAKDSPQVSKNGIRADAQIAAGSLGRFLRPNLESFPRRKQYLFADEKREIFWKAKLAKLGQGLKVGISWRSANTKGKRALQCTELLQWEKVLKLPGVKYVNLQYDECEGELAEAEATFEVHIHRFPEVNMFDDLDETAALMRSLDLVISAPTSVSVLSAALGVPTWQLHFGPLWQCHGQPNSPWYRAMRSYFLNWDEDWDVVFSRVARELSVLLGLTDRSTESSPGIYRRNEHFELSAALRDLQQSDRESASQRLRAFKPSPGIISGLAMLELAVDNNEEAFDSSLSRAAAGVCNNLAEFDLALGYAWLVLGRIKQARPQLEEAIRLEPKNAPANEALGQLESQEGNAEAAVRRLEIAFRSDRASSQLRDLYSRQLDLLGLKYIGLERNAEAAAVLFRAASLAPESAQVQYHLGCTLQALNRSEEAIAAYQKAVALAPAAYTAWNNLGNTLGSCARHEEALECYRKVLELDPAQHGVRSNMLLTLNYVEHIEPGLLRAESLEYGARVAQESASVRNFDRRQDPNRRLRIGYVSPDFRDHAVARFLEPILAQRNRESFEVFCYSCNTRTDEVTERLKLFVDGWRSIVNMNDAAASELIRTDRIDVLVDLAGHTALNRLPVFAYRPAPLQISYMGYPATTGIEAMDYKIVDSATLTPDKELDGQYTESVWRLAPVMWSYLPSQDMPDVFAPPCQKNGYVTFGSFNNIIKIGPELAGLWARIMQSVPKSRLLLTNIPVGEAQLRIADWLSASGVDLDRIDFRPRAPMQAFWKHYAEADIALDTFPCNGGTTTFETLWMGVPVVTMGTATDTRLVSRVSQGILRTLELGELVAIDADDYIQCAAALSQNKDRLVAMRANLRQKMRQSAYMDYSGFASALEGAFRQMWLRRCMAAAD